MFAWNCANIMLYNVQYIYKIKLSFNHKGDDLKWEEQACNIAYIVSIEKWLLNWSCNGFFFEP